MPEDKPIFVNTKVYNSTVNDILSRHCKQCNIPVIARIAAPGASVVLLVKPQFEVGKGNLGKGGIVEDRHLRDQALETVVDCANQHGLTVAGTAPSPIEGTHGNTEFLLFARMDDIAAKAD